MTRKPNFVKFLLGTCVLALLFIGTWATTRTPLTSAKTSATKATAVANNPASVARYAAPLAPASGEDSIFSVFEIEGDIQDNPAGPPDDWGTVNCGGGTALVKTGVIFDGLGKSIYTTGGSKDPELLSSWRHKDGSVPDKDEIINAYAAKYLGTPNGDDILVFGADRYSNDGTAFIGIWFFKQSVYAAADGRFRQGPLATDALSAHVVGDVLVLVNFTGGGSVPTAKVFEWVGTGGSESGGTLNDITGTNSNPAAVFSVSNALAQTLPGTCPAWVHTPKTGPNGTIQINDFFEGGINLNAFPLLTGSCFSSFLVETRSAASVTSTLKDFTLGQFNTCASIEVSKTADDADICEGHQTSYTYVVHNTSGVVEDVTLIDDNETATTADDIDVPTCTVGGTPTHFTLQANDGVAGSGTDQRSFQCSKTLSVGSHTNVVTARGTFGTSVATATASATVLVHENPSVSVNSPTVCAANLPQSLTATVTGGGGSPTYLWSGPEQSGATTQSISVSTAGTYTVVVTDANGCAGQGSGTLTINPNASCGLTGPAETCAGTNGLNYSSTGSNIATHSWSITGNGAIPGSKTGSSVVVNAGAAGSFTLRDDVVSAAGCASFCTYTVTVDANPVASIATETCTTTGNSLTLHASATVGAAACANCTFVWTRPDASTTTGATLDVTAAGTYSVVATQPHAGGAPSCPSASATKHVGLCAN
jgi:hypothetical protein